MAIRFDELVETHGEAKATQIGNALCNMHGGMSFYEFKTHRGGMDVSGCSDADKAKIANLVKAEGKVENPKEGVK